MSEDTEYYETIGDILKARPPTWRQRIFALLPVCYRVKRLRLFVFEWWHFPSFSANAIPWITKKHCIDILVPVYRKWYQLPITGFQIWY